MRKRWKYIVIIIIILIFLLFLIIHNILNNTNFFELSISSFLTLFTAFFISFYLVQKNTDQRHQKQIYCNLLMDTQKLVTNPDTYAFTTNTKSRTITAQKRSLSNYIKIINSLSKKFGLEEEAGFIMNKFNEYEDLIGNHITDIPYLCKSKEELQRPLDLINNKLYEMMLKLYN